MASEIKVDTISEKTSAGGVTIDGLLIKDGGISGDVSLIGTTPTFTIGDAGAEDAALVFDGNAKDFYIALDDSADKLVIGEGSTVGTNSILTITDDTVTIGDAAAVDTAIVFDGNAQDYYIALDDSADDLLIGKGSTVGTTPAISIDSDLKVNIPVTTASTSASTGSLITGGGMGVGADLYVGDDTYLITDSAVLGFGADKDTTLTHTDGTGLTLNSTNKLTFGDAASFIHQSSDGVLTIDGEATVDINASAAITLAAANVPVTVGGIPFYYGDTGSIYTHNVSGTDSTAQYNTAYGLTALDAITSGDQNTVIGYAAGGGLTSGEGNTLIGSSAGGGATMTGNDNVMIGKDAGTDATDTADCVIIGKNAGNAMSSCDNNVAIGRSAMPVADGEGDCIAIGKNTLLVANDGCTEDICIGVGAGDAITSGDRNVLIGHETGSAITTGSENVFIGEGIATGLTTGSNNIMIGRASGIDDADGANRICIGCSPITAADDNNFYFGKPSNVVSNDFGTDANWSRSSDVRKKRNIHDQELGLDFINDLRTVRFQWKPSNEFPKEWYDYHEENTMDLDVTMHGLIAQEVKEALDKHASENDKKFSGWREGKDGMQHTSREMYVIPLIKAVQELTARVKELEDK